jgi:hypothetical protein
MNLELFLWALGIGYSAYFVPALVGWYRRAVQAVAS